MPDRELSPAEIEAAAQAAWKNFEQKVGDDFFWRIGRGDRLLSMYEYFQLKNKLPPGESWTKAMNLNDNQVSANRFSSEEVDSHAAALLELLRQHPLFGELTLEKIKEGAISAEALQTAREQERISAEAWDKFKNTAGEEITRLIKDSHGSIIQWFHHFTRRGEGELEAKLKRAQGLALDYRERGAITTNILRDHEHALRELIKDNPYLEGLTFELLLTLAVDYQPPAEREKPEPAPAPAPDKAAKEPARAAAPEVGGSPAATPEAAAKEVTEFETLNTDALLALYKQFLGYQDTNPNPDSDWSLLEIIEKQKNIAKYSSALAYLLKNRPGELKVAFNKIRVHYDTAIKALGIGATRFGQSVSWTYWDLAKQTYFVHHPTEADPRYHLGDPLSDSIVATDISNRHLGWELRMTYELASDKKQKEELLQSFRQRDRATAEQIEELLNAPPDSSVHKTELSSIKLAQLGALARKNLGLTEVIDFNTATATRLANEAPHPGVEGESEQQAEQMFMSRFFSYGGPSAFILAKESLRMADPQKILEYVKEHTRKKDHPYIHLVPSQGEVKKYKTAIQKLIANDAKLSGLTFDFLREIALPDDEAKKARKPIAFRRFLDMIDRTHFAVFSTFLTSLTKDQSPIDTNRIQKEITASKLTPEIIRANRVWLEELLINDDRFAGITYADFLAFAEAAAKGVDSTATASPNPDSPKAEAAPRKSKYADRETERLADKIAGIYARALDKGQTNEMPRLLSEANIKISQASLATSETLLAKLTVILGEDELATFILLLPAE